MILLDGKKIADRMILELAQEIIRMKKNLRLAVVAVGADPVVENFIAQKKKVGGIAGIDVRVYPFDASITTNELRRRIAAVVHEEKNTAVIIQLPLPPGINKQYILNAIPPEKDADVLSARALGNFASGKSRVIPPVVGAIRALLGEYGIDYRTRSVVVVGAGNLVGRPVALWLMQEGVNVSVLGSTEPGRKKILADADIVITGIGKPQSLTGAMLKQGVVVIDAGTSESEGRVAGDADPRSLASRASYVTPVPGGVGPLTVAVLFKNVVTLARV